MIQYAYKSQVPAASDSYPGKTFIVILTDEGEFHYLYNDGDNRTCSTSNPKTPPSNFNVFTEIPKHQWVFQEYLHKFGVSVKIKNLEKCDCDGFTLLHGGHKCGL